MLDDPPPAPWVETQPETGHLAAHEWAALRTGAPKIQELLYQRYAEALYRAIRAWARWLKPDEAEDLLGEAFVRILRGVNSVQGPERLEGWMFTVARNTVHDYARKRGRSVHAVSLDDLSAPARDAVMEAAAAREHEGGGVLERISAAEDRETLSALVGQVLAELPPRHQEVLRARFGAGVKRAELAERLGVAPEAAASLLYRAKESFRAAFRRRTARQSDGKQSTP